MTLKQRILKLIYPVWMQLSPLLMKMRDGILNNHQYIAPVSFYSLAGELNSGDRIDFSVFKGKKVMVVNTASDCGYTKQYAELEQLHERYQGKLVILAFPANDFKNQEKRSDAEIARFCRTNYDIQFPLMKKSSVKKSAEQNSVFSWLSDPEKNGWNSWQPSWNFTKYLIDENGMLTNYFGAVISPLDKRVINAIENQIT